MVNAGSAVANDGVAANALHHDHARDGRRPCLSGPMPEWITSRQARRKSGLCLRRRGRPSWSSALPAVSGRLTGLGIIGIAAGIVPWFM